MQGSRVLGVGWNRQKETLGQWSTHAEISALANAQGSVRGATVYVARVKRDGSLGDATPCGHCSRVLKDFGIKRVVSS